MSQAVYRAQDTGVSMCSPASREHTLCTISTQVQGLVPQDAGRGCGDTEKVTICHKPEKLDEACTSPRAGFLIFEKIFIEFIGVTLVHCSIIYNSQDLEATQMPISK